MQYFYVPGTITYFNLFNFDSNWKYICTIIITSYITMKTYNEYLIESGDVGGGGCQALLSSLMSYCKPEKLT